MCATYGQGFSALFEIHTRIRAAPQFFFFLNEHKTPGKFFQRNLVYNGGVVMCKRLISIQPTAKVTPVLGCLKMVEKISHNPVLRPILFIIACVIYKVGL